MRENETNKAIGRATKKAHKGVMNGRALFTFNPDLFKDADAVAEVEEAKVDNTLFEAEEANEEEVDFD